MNYKENISLLNICKLEIHKIKPIGLCFLVYVLHHRNKISQHERLVLNKLIRENKPFGNWIYDCGYYFEPYKIEPRLKYLDHLILLNNPNFFIRLYYKFKFRKLYK
jgi:hypothetical protein